MVQLSKGDKLDYQLAASRDNRLIQAERAIQIFKNHFIAVCSGMDPHFFKINLAPRAKSYRCHTQHVTSIKTQPIDFSVYVTS